MANISLEQYLVPTIVVACLVVGYVIKSTPIFNKIANSSIPLIVTVLGAVLGVVLNGASVEAIIYGAVSGLASTGLHQMFRQFISGGEDDNDRHE